jgi:hypothetical protein
MSYSNNSNNSSSIREDDEFATLSTQNSLLLSNLKRFFENKDHLLHMMQIINGETRISLRIVDWFVTNYAKKNYVVYDMPSTASGSNNNTTRFKVHNDYKLKLKSYSKRRFDPFCRHERIRIPYDAEKEMETTIGQLNFFKWSIENGILDYIDNNYEAIETDMNARNSLAKRKTLADDMDNKTRKKREELSISACKCIKKEHVKIIVSFN